MVFADYEDLERDLLKLPYKGKVYTVPEVGISDGIRFTAIREDKEAAEAMTDTEFYKTYLGSAYDEMLADNVPTPFVSRAALTAAIDWEKGRSAAEAFWATGGDPKAMEAYIQAKISEFKRATRQAAQKRSTGTAAATTTRQRVSTSGTKTSRSK
jgi:hypothetical protein